MLSAIARLLSLAISAGAAGCTLSSPYGDPLTEADETTCANDIDDDIDGIFDCYDDDCRDTEVCKEGTEASCSDGDDDDVDSFVDCYDSGCASTEVCQEDGEASCSDGTDNDVDGTIDCFDDGCEATEVCREDDDARCGNGRDDDGDGTIDCRDDGCDGRCPEEDASYCADGRDNDGDGVLDAADARCWPFRRVEAERCSSIDATDYVEHFEDPFAFAGGFYTVGGDAGVTLTGDGGPALVLASVPGRVDLTTIGTIGSFRGAYRGLDLSVLVNILIEGSAVRIGLVPEGLAPIGAPRGVATSGDIAAIVVQDRVTASAASSSGEETLPWTGTGWQRITLREVDGALEATIAPVLGLGTGVRAVFPPLPLGDMADDATPSFRVVIDAIGAVFVRDLHLALGAFDPCGTTVPQLPPGARIGVPGGVVSMGEAVSVARGEADVLCALVTGCEWDGSGTWPTTRSYRSLDDGIAWVAGDRAFPIALSANYARRGLSVAWDPERSVFVALSTGSRDASGALRLAVSESADCSTWSAARPIDLRYAPLDAGVEACGASAAGIARPSYVVRRADGASRHEIYLTTTTRSRGELVLLRATSPDGTTFGEPEELARFEASELPGEPLAVTVIGASDLVLTSPLGPSEGRSGIAVRVALDEVGSRWARIGDVLLGPSGTPGTFDRFQIVSGALAPTREGAVLVYGGAGDFRFDPFVQTDGNVSAGTASIRFYDLVSGDAP